MTALAAIVERLAGAWMACEAAVARAFARSTAADDESTAEIFRRSALAVAFDAGATTLARAWRASLAARVAAAVRAPWMSATRPARARACGVFVVAAAAVHLALLTMAGPSRVAAQWLLPIAALAAGVSLAVRGRLAP